MKKYAFLITAILAASLCWVGCNKAGKLSKPSAFVPPSGPVELKLKWTVGEHIAQGFEAKMNMDISGTNLPETIHQDMTLGEDYGLNVLNATPDGGHEVELEILGLRMQVTQGGKPVLDYDSAKRSSVGSDNPALAGVDKMFQNVIGTKIDYFLDASNQVERIEGFDALMSKLAASSQAQAANSLKSLFNENSLKQMIGSQHLPPKPVQPGDSWPEQTDITMGELGTMATDYTFTFVRWETNEDRTCARLEFQGTLKSKPNQAPASASGETFDVRDGDSSGVAWFDPELGLVTKTIMNQNMNMSMTMPMPGRRNATQGMSIAMKQDITMRVKSVK